MVTLAFDGRMGASGDMILGALLAAGADPDALAPVEDALGVRYDVGRTTKAGVDATSVRVVVDEDPDDRGDGDGETGRGGHTDEHEHDHDGHHQDHEHEHDPAGRPAEGRGPYRTYAEVIEVVESMALPAGVEDDATAVFRILGEAEASVHGTDLEGTHFHEVGADDAIADVVGAALLLENLGVDRVVSTPQSVGGGTVDASHGTYPVPAPAVAVIAERADWSIRGGPVEAELLTPTGAALLAHYADGVDALPALDVDAVGYGAGARDVPEHPNVLRALVGESGGELVEDPVSVLETTVDDVSPEVLGGLQSSLAEAGARDVSVLPATMKKSRPGHLVQVVTKPADARRVARRLAEETGTLGVRETPATHRFVARRSFESVAVSVDGEDHEVRVKVATDDASEVFDASAEYDDAAAVADATGLPVREVLLRAERLAGE